jgi:hypothetical protein
MAAGRSSTWSAWMSKTTTPVCPSVHTTGQAESLSSAHLERMAADDRINVGAAPALHVHHSRLRARASQEEKSRCGADAVAGAPEAGVLLQQVDAPDAHVRRVLGRCGAQCQGCWPRLSRKRQHHNLGDGR